MMNLRRGILLAFALVFITAWKSYGQLPRNKNHFPPGAERLRSRSLSLDSVKAKYYFLNGLREKTLGEANNAIRNFLLCIDLNPGQDAAYYELAVAYQSIEQKEAALVAINKAIQFNKNQVWYYQLKGNLLLQLGQLDSAVQTYDTLIDLQPLNVGYYFDKASALVLSDRLYEAMEVYSKIEKDFGYSEELILSRQRVYLKKGNLQEAVKEMEGLIKRNPDEVRFYLMVAELYESNNLIEKAYEKYQQALKIAPDNGYLHLALADYYKGRGNKVAVLEEVKQAFASDEIDLDSKIQLLYNNYVDSEAQGVKNEALLLSNLLINKYPEDYRVYSIRADFMFITNKKREASDYYKKSLELNKKNYAVWEQLIRVQLNGSNFRDAELSTTEALGYFPDKVNLYLFDGIAKTRVGNSIAAIASYQKGLPLTEGNKQLAAQFYSGLGDVYHLIGKYSESDQAYESSLLLDNNNAIVLNNYAYYLSLRGKDLMKAERMASRANQLEPNNTSYEDTYGWVLYRQGRYQDARMWIEKAMSNSRSAAVFEHYGDVLFKLGEREAAISYWKKAKEFGSKSELLERKINDQALHE